MSDWYTELWDTMTAHFQMSRNSIHGPRHWKQVEKNGLLLARLNGADEHIIRLFAALHDVERQNDGYDPDHGRRAAELATQLRGEHFEITDDQFAELHFALSFHNDGTTTDDLNIGTCWDADRMDLPRVMIYPKEHLMNSVHGKAYARLGADEFARQYLE